MLHASGCRRQARTETLHLAALTSLNRGPRIHLRLLVANGRGHLRMRRPVAFAAGLSVAIGLAVTTARPQTAAAASTSWTTDQSVTYQESVAHTGAQDQDSLKTPLIQKWVHSFGNFVSYPVVAGGRVFVTVAASKGTSLFALDQASGSVDWGPIAITSTYPWSDP